MSNSRHPVRCRSLSLTLPPGAEISDHSHEWPQLVYAAHGVLTVMTSPCVWVVPPMRALLVDADVDHTLKATGAVALRTIYLRPEVLPSRETPCSVLAVSALLREVVLSIVATGTLNDEDAFDRSRMELLIQLLITVPEQPLDLPLPEDPRARCVADKVVSDPGAQKPLLALVKGSGASARTIERLFLRETGMPFGRWRQQARLLESLILLGHGMKVSSVAEDVGYRSASAFVAAFRKALGSTPTKYFAS